MTKDYEPPPDAADVFAQYKTHHEGERTLKPKMLQLADRELEAGATVGQLAKLTGLLPEVFRRRARALGVERRRAPTVGKLATDSPQPESRPAATKPRQQVTQAIPEPTEEPEPLDLTGIFPEVAALPHERIKELVTNAEARQPKWVEEIRQEYPNTDERRLNYLIVNVGFRQGRKPPELAADPRPRLCADRPVTAEEAAEFAMLARSHASEMQLRKLDQEAEKAPEGSKGFAVMHAALDMGLLKHDEVYGARPASSAETSEGPVRPDEEPTL